MAVFEDKFRPDMEVCKFLQFYSLSHYLSSCMLDIYKLIADSSEVWTALLLVGMLFGTGTMFAEKTGYLGKLHFGVACYALPQAWGACTVQLFALAFGLSGNLLGCKCCCSVACFLMRYHNISKWQVFCFFTKNRETMYVFACHTDLAWKCGQFEKSL